MKMQNKLVIKYLTIVIFWVGGITGCIAQDCGDCGCKTGYECFCDIQDPNLYPDEPGHVGPLPGGPICLTQTDETAIGLGKSYCTWGSGSGIIIAESSLGCQGITFYGTFLPLSDASFLLLFLLAIYGFFIYRKQEQAAMK